MTKAAAPDPDSPQATQQDASRERRLAAPDRPKTDHLADLLSGAARGEPEAVDAWFRAEHGPVYRVCLGILGEAEAAADVAQDAMLHLLERLDRYDPERPWRAWRDTVVLRLCRDRARRRAARARAERTGGEGSLAARASAQEEPGAALEAQETQALVADALRVLPEREREAFVLRDLEGLSTADAAGAMGVGASTVRSLLTLARRRLREHLAPRLDPRMGSETEGGRP